MTGTSPISHRQPSQQSNQQSNINQKKAIISINSQSNQSTTSPHIKQTNISNLFLCIHTQNQKYISLIIFKDFL
jgi:hypothetical protein